MGLANLGAFVAFVNGCDSVQAGFLANGNRLSAATDATARTSHDFNEMVVRFASANFIHHDPGIGQGIGNGNFDGQIADLQGCFLDAGQAAHRFKVD